MTDPLNPTPDPIDPQTQPGGSPMPSPGSPAVTPGDATPPEAPAAPSKDERTMAMLAHLLGVLSVIGPLIIWMIKKDESRFVDDQGKESLNFQLTALIVWVAIAIFSVITCGIGSLLVPVFLIVILVFCILGAVKANDGVAYRYPINIRMIK